MRNVYSIEYKAFLVRLREARNAANLTQAEVALRLKKPQTFVSKSELGERRLDVIELKHFAKLYKKPLSFFVD
jgi:transcriptional regulator with XRE-family HTH domain